MTPDEQYAAEVAALLEAIPHDADEARRRHTITQPIPEDDKPLLRLDVMWRGLVARGLWSEEKEIER